MNKKETLLRIIKTRATPDLRVMGRSAFINGCFKLAHLMVGLSDGIDFTTPQSVVCTTMPDYAGFMHGIGRANVELLLTTSKKRKHIAGQFSHLDGVLRRAWFLCRWIIENAALRSGIYEENMGIKLDVVFSDWEGLTYFQAAQRLCDHAATYADLAHELENMTSENPLIEAFLRVCEQATLASAYYEPDAKPIPQGICVWELPIDMQNRCEAALRSWALNGEALQFDTKFLRPDFSVLED